jgi:hypothetical protein
MYAPFTWNIENSSMELDTFEFMHVEWLHACTFLEVTFHVDTWHLNWIDAYFWSCPLHDHYLVHITAIFG